MLMQINFYKSKIFEVCGKARIGFSHINHESCSKITQEFHKNDKRVKKNYVYTEKKTANSVKYFTRHD